MPDWAKHPLNCSTGKAFTTYGKVVRLPLCRMHSLQKKLPKKVTARRHIVATLTQEILSRAEPHDFPTESESELCMRFGVSRVTVRLALADLEHRRLIYRRHGKGTFAHGTVTRAHPNIGILVKSPDDVKSPELVEFNRGALTVMTSVHSSVVLIAHPPLTWRADTTNAFGGVIVFQGELAKDEADSLNRRKIPFISVSVPKESSGDTDYCQLGTCTAQRLAHALVSGTPVGEPERQGLPSESPTN